MTTFLKNNPKTENLSLFNDIREHSKYTEANGKQNYEFNQPNEQSLFSTKEETNIIEIPTELNSNYTITAPQEIFIEKSNKSKAEQMSFGFVAKEESPFLNNAIYSPPREYIKEDISDSGDELFPVPGRNIGSLKYKRGWSAVASMLNSAVCAACFIFSINNLFNF